MEELGAQVVIDPEGFEEHGPYDVILELVGASNLAGNLKALATRGRIAVIGVGGTGPQGEINLLALMQKHARIHGSTLRARPLEQKAAAARLVEKEVLPGLRPVSSPCQWPRPTRSTGSRTPTRASRPARKLGKIVLLP